MNKLKMYLKLFKYTLQLSALTFGGGYVIVSMMKKQLVDKLGLISEEKMLDLTAIAQASPGALAVNASVMVGFHLLGIPGALIAIAGAVTPPLIILSFVSVGYTAFADNPIVSNVLRGMQAGVCAILIDTVLSMSGSIYMSKKVFQIIIMFAAFCAVTIFRINVMYVIIVCGLIGFISALVFGKRNVENDIS